MPEERSRAFCFVDELSERHARFVDAQAAKQYSTRGRQAVALRDACGWPLIRRIHRLTAAALSLLSQLTKWDDEQIAIRATTLSQKALSVWTSPSVDDETLAAYKDEKKAGTGYTIEDHPHLISPTVAPLFESFRKQVLALNPCVTEDFLKLYVAYKAETNFVDVVPQSKRLRLSINIDHHEINDPRQLTKDVSNRGRWGNGNVEVFLNTLEELPYILGLVRQAFEKQMGNSSED